MDTVIERLERIQSDIDELKLLKKEVLNFNEACAYLSDSPSSLYKKTHKGSIPHYCPNGKKLFFRRTELDDWLVANPRGVKQKEEIEKMAADYLVKKGRTK